MIINMNNLLIFFAIPFAIIIFSIALQKLLKCPYLVATIIFSIFLLLGIALENNTLLIGGVVYTIISFISAYLTMLICRFLKNNNNYNNLVSSINNNNAISTISNNNNNAISNINNNRFVARTTGGINGDEFTALTNGNLYNGNNNTGCGCNRR